MDSGIWLLITINLHRIIPNRANQAISMYLLKGDDLWKYFKRDLNKEA